jgi:NLR family CARD domain-containing protein 3
LVPLQYQNKMEQGHLHPRILEEPRFKPHRLMKLNCWICEKWVEASFTWRPETAGAQAQPVFLHLECDAYRPSATELKDDGFTAVRIVPPGQVRFFFSADGKLMRSKEYKTKVLDTPFKLEYAATGTQEKVHSSISKVNAIYIESEKWEGGKITVKPRNDPRVKQVFEIVVERIPWDIKKSSFAEYRMDTEVILEQACSYDFKVSNLKDVIPEPADQTEIARLLRSHYGLITEAFRQLSATSGIELFAISKTTLAEFLKRCNLLTPDYNLNDIAVLWNLSNAPQSKGEVFNAGNGLCRYEFAEFLVRLALDRYWKPKRVQSQTEAFEKLLSEHVVDGLRSYDQSSWRTESYLTEDVDCVLKAFKPILEEVYAKYAAMGKGPLDTMNLHEFRMLCNEAGLISSQFVLREIDMCFRQAMITEVDEILDGEHLEMSYVEFIEAVTRVANTKYMKDKKLNTVAKRLEAIMPDLIKVCSDYGKNNFEMPTEETYFNMKYVKKTIARTEIIAPV